MTSKGRASFLRGVRAGDKTPYLGIRTVEEYVVTVIVGSVVDVPSTLCQVSQLSVDIIRMP